MINYKTEKEIKIMLEGGKKLRLIIEQLIREIQPGMTTLMIEERARELIINKGLDISFNKVKGYNFATCLPVNEQIVHTRPSDRVLKEGDLLTIDTGVFYGGFHTDCAETIIIGKKPDGEIKKFLDAGKKALSLAIKKAKNGAYLGEISLAIEQTVTKNGYFIIKRLTGHGIGKTLHEDPFVFGFLNKPVKETLKIRPGLVVAIEVIYSMGTEEMVYEPGDSWSIITKDGSLSACFEKTIAILEDKTLVLT